MNTWNRVEGIFCLGQDPDVRYTPSGTAIATLSGASNHSYKDKDGEWVKNTEWTRFTVFGKRAESAGEHLRKGSYVYIEGRLQTDQWEDRDGNTRYTTKVIANKVDYLANFGSSDGSGSGGKTYGNRNEPDHSDAGSRNPFGPSSKDDDDIPF